MATEVKELVERTVTGMGYEFVDLELANRGRFLRVYIDKIVDKNADKGAEKAGAEKTGTGADGADSADGANGAGGITVDDCASVSNQLSRVFEVEDIDYDRLEISSPGLDRPLKKATDFVRFAGQIAQLRLRVPQDGKRTLTGVLRELRDEILGIEVEGKLVSVALDNLEKARLVPKF
jgi:ribosome maturation factor RimP